MLCVHACRGQRAALGVTPQELPTLVFGFYFLFCFLILMHVDVLPVCTYVYYVCVSAMELRRRHQIA